MTLPKLFERWTEAQASRPAILSALQLDAPRRRGAVLAYVGGEAPTTIAKRLGIGVPGLQSLIKSSMRACYRRIYGASLPSPNPDRPSRQARRTGYRTDSKRHAAAREKVPARKRKNAAKAAAKARWG